MRQVVLSLIPPSGGVTQGIRPATSSQKPLKLEPTDTKSFMFVKFLYGSMMYGALAFQIATRRTILPSARRASVLLRAESSLSETDEKYLRLAIDHASQGKGKTFPNPAVGCVLVRQEDGAVLGSGFHPR